MLDQDETPLLYSLVFGEGVVNDATSVVLFNAIQSFDLTNIDPRIALHFTGNFLYLFITSTILGVMVSISLSHTCTLVGVNAQDCSVNGLLYYSMTYLFPCADWAD